MPKFSQLSKEAQNYINQRFEQHGMSGEHAFDNTDIFTDEVKDFVGDIKVANLGIQREVYESNSNCYLLDIEDRNHKMACFNINFDFSRGSPPPPSRSSM